jgi:8-oxo-dGTP diphosphatase
VPTLGVLVAIIDDGRLLLTQRADLPVWVLPGGGIEAGESAAEAAVREAREETGLTVSPTRLVGVYSRPRWRRGGSHELLFAAEPIAGTLRPQPGEVRDLRYCAPDDLPRPLVWWHRRPIRDALAGLGGGVAVSQGALWPFPEEMGYQEALASLAGEGEPLSPRLRALWCGQPTTTDERLEVGPTAGSGTG